MPVYQPQMGTPCWVDLTSTDLEHTIPFYGELFGWSFTNMGSEFGNYHIVTVGEEAVGGAIQYQPEFMGPEPINSFSLYFSTADVTKVGKRAQELGGKVIFEPMNVGDQGSNTELLDPSGTHFGLWQPEGRKGFDRIHEHGFPTWFELNTRSFDAVHSFYATLLGGTLESAPLEDDERYETLMINGAPAAGIWDIEGVLPTDAPIGWLVFFAVDDIHEAIRIINRNGGAVLAEPEEIQYGTMATVQDPTRTVFKLLQR